MDPPSLDQLATLYKSTTEKRGLRRLFVDWLLQESTSDWIRESNTEQVLRTSSDMAADFVFAINDIREHDEDWHPFDDNNAGDYY